MNVKLYAHINQWAERCQARKWFQLSAVSRLIISMVSTYFYSFLCSSSYCLFGKIFFLRFMTFDFEWVCLRKSENIMSDACCLVLLFFSSFSSIWIVLVCLVLASILLLCKFSICWDDLSLNFFRCLSWQLFTFPLLFALASITTLQTLNALLIRWRRCCSLLCVFITFRLCLMLFFTFVERSNQFVSTEIFIKTRDAVVQHY